MWWLPKYNFFPFAMSIFDWPITKNNEALRNSKIDLPYFYLYKFTRVELKAKDMRSNKRLLQVLCVLLCKENFWMDMLDIYQWLLWLVEIKLFLVHLYLQTSWKGKTHISDPTVDSFTRTTIFLISWKPITIFFLNSENMK